MTAFLKSPEYSLHRIIDENEEYGAKMLLDPVVQEQFKRVMAAGNADAHFDEIDWQKVVDLWDQPVPKGFQ